MIQAGGNVSASELTLVVGEDRRSVGLRPKTWIWRADDGLAAGSILDARYQIVPFSGRTRELADIEDWCLNGRGVVRLYSGAGGLGKTRLMIEACNRMHEGHGWMAGFADTSFDQPGEAALAELMRMRESKLIVLDYAETKTETVARVLEAAHSRPGDAGKVRVVLLAREGPNDAAAAHGAQANDIPWIASVKAQGAGAQGLMGGMTSLPLQPIADTAATRQEAYRAARPAFARALALENPGTPAEPDFTQAGFERVLFIHAAALASLEGQTLSDRQDLLEYMLDREQRSWARGITLLGLQPLQPNHVQLAAALVTLNQGFDRQQDAQAALASIRVLSDQAFARREQVLTLLAQLYPGEREIEPVRPDLLGEHVVIKALEQDDGLLAACLEPPISPAAAFTVLTRLGQRHEAAARNWLQPFADALTAKIKSGDTTLAKSLLNLMPDYTKTLRRLKCCVYGAIIPTVPLEQKPEYRAGLLRNYALSLLSLGRNAEALAAIRESVSIRRTLVQIDRDQHLPELLSSIHILARTLIELSRALSSAGDTTGTRSTAREALTLLETSTKDSRTFYQMGDHRYNIIHFQLLNTLFNAYYGLRTYPNALKINFECIDTYNRSPPAIQDKLYPHLPRVYTNQGWILSALNKHDSALCASLRAVKMESRLAATNLDAHTMGMAKALRAYADCLDAAGHLKEALEATAQSIKHLQPMFLSEPDAEYREMRILRQQYIERCHRYRVKPDTDLLGPIDQVLDRLKTARER